MTQLSLTPSDFQSRAISPFVELGAYEALWDTDNASFKNLAELFAREPEAVPSSFVDPVKSTRYANEVHAILKKAGVSKYGVRVHGAGEYPDRLRDAEYPIELLYFQGRWDLIYSPRSIAVVGTRDPSEEAIRRTRKLVKSLLADDFTIVSGLAKGIDSTAHATVIAEGGRTVAVLGTPLSRSYPSQNKALQREIAEKHLVISQVPVKRYDQQPNPTANRYFFPERNVTMSALTDATIIVEAGETSGTLVQAKAALKQGRKLFILDSCFNNPSLAWPQKFLEHGAIRVREYDDIRTNLLSASVH
ncbi:MAG: DNA-processing protein DprA [Beijerinckiaceae bacterium]